MKKRSHEEVDLEDKDHHSESSNNKLREVQSVKCSSTSGVIPKSIFYKQLPQPDLTLQITSFLFSKILSKEAKNAIDTIRKNSYVLGVEIEIEGKLGTIIDRKSSNSNRRINFPIKSETIVNNDYREFVFDSNMSMKQHANFNKLLNNNVAAHTGKVKYVHLREIDQFFNVPNIGKVRRTLDEKTRKIKTCIMKHKLGDLEIHCPCDALDFRISVNLETTILLPVSVSDEDVGHSRKKDRLSYSLAPFQIDLTQVKTFGGRDDGSLTHELEVEFTHCEDFIAELKKGTATEYTPKAYEYTEAFLNNMRILARFQEPIPEAF